MAVEMATLCEYLDEEGLTYDVSREGDRIYVPFPGCMVIVHVCEEGEGIVFYAPNVFNLEETEYREDCLNFMGHHNYRVKIGAFGHDVRDGEVNVSDFYPVEDGGITRRQFVRMVHMVAAVARRDGARLRQVAYGKDPDETDKGIEAPADLRDFFESLSDGEGVDGEGEAIGHLPAAPVDERTWLLHATRSFGSLAASTEDDTALLALRNDVWPRLYALRADSVAAGESYRSLDLAARHALRTDEEMLLMFMLARHAAGDRRIFTKELDRVYGPGPHWLDTPVEVQRLVQAGLIEARDQDKVEPYCLTRRLLDEYAEADVLPFAYEPLPAPFTAADVPTTPISESAWLELVHHAVAADADDRRDLPRLAMLRDEVWPALLELRHQSISAGECYTTAGAAKQYALSPHEELVVALVAARAAAGDHRVDVVLLDEVHPPESDRQERSPFFQRLMENELLSASDEDDRPPFTIGRNAEPWVGS